MLDFSPARDQCQHRAAHGIARCKAHFVGLDSEATKIGDRLWHGEALDDRTAGRMLALFRLSVTDAGLVAGIVEQEPVYLIMAMTPDLNLRMKPQNLLTGLPIKHLEAAS